ncbi:hypothetical protein BDF14DRAFT_1751452 [Spinellus fusiger]|nr:hypothetical protein BDF14DRAFT_1751452 [Spinellus fusiger]
MENKHSPIQSPPPPPAAPPPLHCSFYCCYLIRSLDTQHTNRTYVGSTPNPLRRLRQHNGDISQGAKKTRSYRPWELVMLVHGFPNPPCALAFENAWQHPLVSRHLKRAQQYTAPNSSIGMRSPQHAYLLLSKMRAVHDVLSTKPFSRWPLHLHFATPVWQYLFMAEGAAVVGKPLPHHMLSTVGDIDSFYSAMVPKQPSPTCPLSLVSQTPVCYQCKRDICRQAINTFVTCSVCAIAFHLTCLAHVFLGSSIALVPVDGQCPKCDSHLRWGDLIQAMTLRLEWQKKNQEQ